MTYEDLLRLYMVDELNAHELYRIIRDWCAANGFNLVFVINTLCDDSIKIICGEFLID